jgi:hypothetical protein
MEGIRLHLSLKARFRLGGELNKPHLFQGYRISLQAMPLRFPLGGTSASDEIAPFLADALKNSSG